MKLTFFCRKRISKAMKTPNKAANGQLTNVDKAVVKIAIL